MLCSKLQKHISRVKYTNTTYIHRLDDNVVDEASSEEHSQSILLLHLKALGSYCNLHFVLEPSQPR